MLSGFLIGGILVDVRESPNYFKTFYGRRFFRIVPLYYLWISIFFVVEALRSSPGVLRSIPVYLLFVQNSVKMNHASFALAWLGALWSLAIEEQFYLIIPTIVRLFSRRNLLLVLGAAVAFAPLFRILIHKYVPWHPVAPYSLTVCRADALAMGVLLAIGWRSDACRAAFYRYRSAIYGVSVLLFCAFLYLAVWRPFPYTLTMYSWGYSVIDVFYASALAIAIMVPSSIWATICRFPFLSAMGRISYCLYIIHQAVDFGCHELLFHTLPRFKSWPTIFATLLAAVLAYGLATFSWRFFEQPLLRKGHALKY